jgi:hypothetical protein
VAHTNLAKTAGARRPRKDILGASLPKQRVVRLPFRPPGVSRQKSVEQRRIDTEIGLTQPPKADSSQAAFGSAIQHADDARYRQTQAARLLDALPLVHDHEVCFQAEGQKDGIVLAPVQIGQLSRSGALRQSNHLKPGRSIRLHANVKPNPLVLSSKQ